MQNHKKIINKAKYMGFTGHQNPKTHLYFLKKLDEFGIKVDACQMPLNLWDPSFESFQHKELPDLLEKKYGVIAMKSMAGDSMMGSRTDTPPGHKEQRYIRRGCEDRTYLCLPTYICVFVAGLCSISGCRFTSELEGNVKVLKEMKKVSESDMLKLVDYGKPYAVSSNMQSGKNK